MSTVSQRLHALAAELRENERSLESLVSTARSVLDRESDPSDVAAAARELAALHMARLIVAIAGDAGQPAAKLKVVK